MKKILVTGSTAYDLLLGYDGSFVDAIDRDALEKLSMAFVTPHFARHHGGTGANIAWTLELLGRDPLLVSTVGSDGGPYLALLEERGIATAHIDRVQHAMTATAIIGSDTSEHQITFYHPGADALGAWPDLSEERDDLAYAIVSPREQRIMLESLQWCHKYHVPVLFDPGQQLFSFSRDELVRAAGWSSGVIANDYEWSLLTERAGISQKDFLKHTEMLIISRGEEGLSIITREETISIPACRVPAVINPTGAGDALRAGMLAGLSAGWSLCDSGRLGAAVASFVVEVEGALLDRLDLDDVRARAKMAYGEELPKI